MPAETVPRRLTFCLSSELPVGIPEKRVDDHARLKRPRVVGRRVATWAHAFVFPTPTFQRPSDSTKSKLVLGTVAKSGVTNSRGLASRSPASQVRDTSARRGRGQAMRARTFATSTNPESRARATCCSAQEKGARPESAPTRRGCILGLGQLDHGRLGASEFHKVGAHDLRCKSPAETSPASAVAGTSACAPAV